MPKPDITLLSIPLSFDGPARTRQLNALHSWKRLGPRVQVALYGNDAGVADTCAEVGAHHFGDVRTNAAGTPLVSDALSHAAANFETKTLLFVNSDIMFCDDLLLSLDRVTIPRFLIVGNRTNLDVDELIDFAAPEAPRQVRMRAARSGALQPPIGSDYFAFPRETPWGMPELAVGRLGWDNWMIFRARQLEMPVIDATGAITAVHQNHDYGHVKSRPQGIGVIPGAEDGANRALAGGAESMFTLWDVTHRLVDGRLVRPGGFKYQRRRLQSAIVLNETTRPAYRHARRAWAAGRTAMRKRGWLDPGNEDLSS